MRNTDEWREVHKHAKRLKRASLASLIKGNAERVASLTFKLDDLTLDLSKEKLDAKALDALLDLARAAKVESWRNRMAAGERISRSEERPALHMALRGSVSPPDGDDVEGELRRFLEFAEAVRSGKIVGKGGKYKDIVCIGVGGSNVGPSMATDALVPFNEDGIWFHFVSNLDSVETLKKLIDPYPETTLVIVSSRSFSTLEVLTNAELASDWLGPLAKTQMVAVTANPERCIDWGISENLVFRCWNWARGRHSVWSAAGLPLAIGIGAKGFEQFLQGAAAMDKHFLEAPLERNLPVLFAMTGVWRRNAMGWPAVAVVPCEYRLREFPTYVQLLEMVSNGKRVTQKGESVDMATGPIVLGAVGTDAHHSFFQYLHQSTDTVPVDFILSARTVYGLSWAHEQVRLNCLAQGMSLAFGVDPKDMLSDSKRIESDLGRERLLQQAAAHHTTGDRPSTTVLQRQLDPYSLGRLMALYEHKVFVQGVVWGVNPFDHFGPEMGRGMAMALAGMLDEGLELPMDRSTKALLARLHELEK